MTFQREEISIKEAFERAGFEVRPCVPKKMSPEELDRAQKIQKACNDYLRYLAKAYEISKNSTLRFCQKTPPKNTPNDFVHQHLKMMEKIKRETDESVKHCHHYARGRIITTHSYSNPLLGHFQRVKD